MGIFDLFGGSKEETLVANRVSELISMVDRTYERGERVSIGLNNGLENDLILDDSDEISSIISSASVPRDRIDRYSVYDEIYQYVPLSKRMLRVYIANILQKNPVVKKSIFVDSSTDARNRYDDSVIEATKRYTEDVLRFFQVKRLLHRKILPTMLKYGDCFVELVDVNQELKLDDNKRAILTTELLNEVKLGDYNLTATSRDVLLDKASSVLFENVDVLQYDTNSDSQVLEFDDIKLRIHMPHNIIILNTTYDNVIGYLEVRRDEFNVVTNLVTSLANLVGRITNIGQVYDSSMSDVSDIVSKIADYTVRKIVKKYCDSRDNIDYSKLNSVLNSIPADVSKQLARFVVSSDVYRKSKQLNAVKVRFIPARRIIHFSVASSEYHPYGMSFLDPLIFQSKLYILSQVSNIVAKLSRAAPLRKWIIETGSTKMHMSLIQDLKRKLQNTRVTLEDLASFKSIPKILSDFRDMFILSKGGVRPLDFEIVMHGDPNIHVDDLESARRELISLSGIPLPYLGYADVVELREQLVHTNVSFATEIIDIQECIADALMELVSKVAYLQGKDLPISEDCIKISLMPPIVLILQLIETMITSTGNINNILQAFNVPVDPYYLLKSYVPFIDWDEMRRVGEEYRFKRATQDEISTSVPSS